MNDDVSQTGAADDPAQDEMKKSSPRLVSDSVIAPPLLERLYAEGVKTNTTFKIIIEPSTAFPGGAQAAREHLRPILEQLAGGKVRDAGQYLAAELTRTQITGLVRSDQQPDSPRADRAPSPTDDDSDIPAGTDAADREPTMSSGRAPRGAIYRIWPDEQIVALIHRSIMTTKCGAVHRAFGGLGDEIVWAVLDSGIDGTHDHFQTHANLDLQGRSEHRSFLEPDPNNPGLDDPLVDEAGHGTHVAAILAGELTLEHPRELAATHYRDDQGNSSVRALELASISGMAPRCKLVSCKVLRNDRTGDLAAMLAALEYVQEVNSWGRDLQIHGVNLSVGYPFDPGWFAAGLTPVCREVDRLVESGVVVVVAAGNTGYGFGEDAQGRRVRMGFDLSINDPGNAELAITVGSTSVMPHASGVSYFSSKGPTGDGRLKPDLVAPGERIVSAGSGTPLKAARNHVPQALYVEDSGTSMAAPHVSGAAAALLSIHREFIGRPRQLKAVLMDTATDLGRSVHFQGRGMIDVMRAIQAV